MTKVTVKWSSKTFEVECRPGEEVRELMQELQKLTGVPIERQSLMGRRKQFKPDEKFEQSQLKPGTKFMLLGTAELPPEEVPVKEDDTEDQPLEEDGDFTEAQKKKIFQGITNLDNYCYLNATLQSLRALPQCESLLETAVCPTNTPDGNVEQTIGRFFKDFPNGFFEAFKALKVANPGLFDQKDAETGRGAQQDASEALYDILNRLGNALGDQFKRLFTIHFHVSAKCDENGKTEERDETALSLLVYISQDTRQIEQGINLEQQKELRDLELDRDLLWVEKRVITSLPQYLIFHIQRFEYKKSEKITAKILRRIIHPFRIDTLPWLSPELRAQVAEDRENGKGNSGFYTLKVVLTHKGRTANAGHYITHCKYGDTWIRFDDDKVKEIDDDDVQALSGSGDWHCSLILIYEKISSE